MDDLAIVANSQSEAQQVLDMFVEFPSACKMSLNLSKFSHAWWEPGNGGNQPPPLMAKDGMGVMKPLRQLGHTQSLFQTLGRNSI